MKCFHFILKNFIDQKNQTKENERKKNSNQTTNLPVGKGSKKSKSNRRKAHGNQIETKQILNSEENERENQLDCNNKNVCMF